MPGSTLEKHTDLFNAAVKFFFPCQINVYQFEGRTINQLTMSLLTNYLFVGSNMGFMWEWVLLGRIG